MALAFAAIWMGATWLFTIPAVLLMGWVGFGVANALVTLTTTPFFYRAVERGLSVQAVAGVLPGLAAGSLAISAGLVAATLRPMGTPVALQVGVLCLAGYTALWLMLSRNSVRRDLAMMKSLFTRDRPQN